MYFSFKDKSFQNISHLIQHSDSDLIYNDESLGEYYLYLLKLRHNCLHYSVLDMIGKKWSEEETVRRFLGINDGNHLLNKTPDIQIMRDTHIMIDVSISMDTHSSSFNKETKYGLVVQYLKNIGIKSKFIHINCSVTRKNIEKEVEKLREFQSNDFKIQELTSCLDIIENKINIVRENIGRDYFEKLKTNNFSDSIENMGYCEDIDIDLDVFKKFNNKFDLEEKILKTYEFQLKEEETFKIFKDILETKDETYLKFLDNKFDSDDFKDSFEQIKSSNDEMSKLNHLKPSHHILFPFDEEMEMYDQPKEQDQIRTFMREIYNVGNKLNEENELFLLELSKEFNNMFEEKNPNKNYNESIFYDYFVKEGETNIMMIYKRFNKMTHFLGVSEMNLDSNVKKYFAITRHNYQEKKILIKEEFEELKSKYKFGKNLSYKEFLERNDIVTSTQEWFSTYAFKNKCVITQLDNKSDSFKRFYNKTGISHKFEKKELKKKFEETIELRKWRSTDFFLKKIQEPSRNSGKENKFSDYLSEVSEMDDEYSLFYKKELTEIIVSKFNYLSSFKSYEYLEKIKKISTQLMHFTMLEMKPGSFSFFTCGIQNFMCVVAGCYNKLFSQLGKPYICCFFTKEPDSYNDFFGKITKTHIGRGVYIVTTGWRRLPSFKLLHLKDQFYSIISSTMNSLLSSHNEYIPLENKRIVKQMSFRTLVGCATGQRSSEFLVDVRYAYISSYARYTNIKLLLLEKFSPPYRTSLEVWIVQRLFERLPIIHRSKENIKPTSADYVNKKRTMNSMGVKFNMPSLWFDYDLSEINEFLDEAFSYVHTLKEPSNIYYENVKAINTIMKFQDQFDNLKQHRKDGIFKKREELIEFLNSDNQVGCFSRLIIDSANLTYNEDNHFFKKIVNDINNEDIGELVSTKAVISDNERKIVRVEEFTKKQIEKRTIKNDYFKSGLTDEDIRGKYVMESNSKMYNNRKPRQKVFETTLEILEENENIEKTIDLANFFIEKENGIVNADICIKAQYGSKREFYVINIGAKALARCTENFFKKMCEKNSHEAISIPGDNKMAHMQKMIDNALLSDKIRPASKMIYVNGDCTKWSAAETMSSFISLIIPLKNKIPVGMYNLLLATYNSWSDKNIQIPLDIINNFIIPGDQETHEKKYSHIRNSILKNNGKFKSTQNFLQGMYNYASSYKAVCCSTYTYYAWKKIYPNSTLYIEHMEHSDDYVLVVMTERFEEFERFRVLHKMIMKCHGFNDSVKKTNCQTNMMEFVSLISFNGMMLYPQIKKTKEVNTNLPCVGYKSDIEASYSRVGEAMRMGCNMSFLYFMEKWQNICVSEAYSLLPGMRNSYTDNFNDMICQPVELFGLIDMLPIFSMFCKGNGNNYRLYKYGDKNTRAKIRYLLEKAQETQLTEEVLVENTDFMYSLFNPKFIYERSNSSIVKLRLKLNWKVDDLLEFWKENVSYKFMKPKKKGKLIKWLKSMFYNRTFTEAYSKSSRAKMTMRISHFIRNPIISLKIDPVKMKEEYPEKNSTLMTMKQYIDYCTRDLKNYKINWNELKEQSLIRIITKCDPTFDAVYEYLKNIKIVERQSLKKQNRPQIPIKTPRKITSVDIVNNPSSIIQYMYNYEDFLADKRHIVSEYSILKDVEIVKENFLLEIKEETRTMELLSLYNNLTILKESPIICIGFSRRSETLKEQIGDIFRYNYLPYANCSINFSDMIRIFDPVTRKLLYTRGGKTTVNIVQQSLENAALFHTYMTLKKETTKIEKRRQLDNLIFKDPLNKNELSFEEILRMVTANNIKTFQLNFATIKLLGYFRAYYLGENDVLLNLVSDYYSYTYKYDLKAHRQGDKWVGETLGTFKHMESVVTFNNIDNPENEKIIIMSEDVNHKMLNLHYNIALRLTSKISEKSFLSNPTRKKMEETKLFDTNKKAFKYFDKFNVTGIYEISGNKMEYVKPLRYDHKKKYLPVMKIGQSHTVNKEKRGELRPSYLRIRNETLMVYLGQFKLFTLPILNCRQFDNVEYIGNERIYKEMMRGDNLYNYFHRRPMITKKTQPFMVLPNTIIREIKNQKLYDFYNESMLTYIDPNMKSNTKEMFESKSGVLGFFIQRGLVKEKKKKDEIELVVEDLANFDFFGEDFLVVEEEDNTGLDLDEGMEFQDVSNFKDVNFMKFYELENDFLIKPNTSAKTLKRNYIIAKLTSIPTFEIEYNRNIYLKNIDSKKMNLYELIESIKLNFRNLKNLKDTLIWYEIYELLCNTYIKLHSSKTIHQYYVQGRGIRFLTSFVLEKTENTMMRIRQISNKNNNIHDLIITDTKISFDVLYSVKTAMEKFNETCSSKFRLFRKTKYIKVAFEMNEKDSLDFLMEFDF